MTDTQHPPPTAIAEAAWRHLVNRHDLAQALDELGPTAGADRLDIAAQRLTRRRPIPAPSNHGEPVR